MLTRQTDKKEALMLTAGGMDVKLTDENQTIRVQLWTNGAWKHNIRGQVIGSHDGIVGVLLDNGEYVDVPEERLRIIDMEGRRKTWTNRKRLKA